MLPALLALGLGLHALLARIAKAVVSSARPLATGEAEACGYERHVYHTAAPQTLAVIGVALAGGLLMWFGYVSGHGSWWVLGLLVVVGAVGLDLWWWERVSASASYVWFQRGWSGEVHQVLIDNIDEISVEETETGGFTLRHGRHNTLCGLSLQMNDKRIAALPNTDAQRALADVEAVANHVRARQLQSQDRRSLSDAQAVASEAAARATNELPSKDVAMRLELQRLRRKALAPELPPAAPLAKK
jgi:hypothetical protein